MASVRSGAATFIADNLAKSGSSDRLLMLHSHWKSERAKKMYSKDSLDSRDCSLPFLHRRNVTYFSFFLLYTVIALFL